MRTKCQPIRNFRRSGVGYGFSIFLLTLLGVFNPTYAQSPQIIDGRGRPGPICTALINPIETAPLDSGISLKLRSVSGKDLALVATSSEVYEKLEVIVDDKRVNFSGLSSANINALNKNPIFALMKSTDKLHLTARLSAGKFATARFENIEFDALLKRMSQECGLLLEGQETKSADQPFVMNEETQRLIKWLSLRIAGKKRDYLSISPTLDGSGKQVLVRAQRMLDLPPTELLNAETSGAFLAAFGIKISPKYQEIKGFRDGLAPMKLGGKWGAIDENDDVIINPGLGDARQSVASYMPIRLGGDWVFMNAERKRLSGARFQKLHTCSETSCGFTKGAKTGIFNLKTRSQHIVKFEKILAFRNGFAPIKVRNKWHLVSESGKVSPKGFAAQSLRAPTDGISVVSYSFRSKGYVNAALSPMFKNARFEDAQPFSSRIAAVKKGGLWGFIDKTRGDFIIEPTFGNVSGFNRGLAAATLDGTNWGYIDKNGRWGIAPRFSEAGDFSQGLAIVKIENKSTVINTRGEIQAPLIFDEIHNFQNGYAAFRLGENWGVLSKSLLRARPKAAKRVTD